MLAQDFSKPYGSSQTGGQVYRPAADRPYGPGHFAGESFTMCPLTTDHAVLKSQLYNVQSGLLEDGTAIGSGLATGVETSIIRFKKQSDHSAHRQEDNGGRLDPNTAKECKIIWRACIHSRRGHGRLCTRAGSNQHRSDHAAGEGEH